MKLEKVISFAGQENLRAEISLTNCGLHVTGNDEKECELRLEVQGLGLQKSEEINLEEFLEVEFDEARNLLKISQEENKKKFSTRRFRIELTVPQKSEISCKNVNGGIKSENIELDQDYNLVNGGIKIVSCQGRLEIKGINGGIKILDHQGDMFVEQKNGGISIQDCQGMMEIDNHNGGIKLNHCNGVLNLKQKNGAIKVLNGGFSSAALESVNSAIYYEFEDDIEPGEFKFTNKLGKIQLIIPHELEYDITARTTLGKVYIGLDKNYEQTGEGEKEFHLVNGAGKIKITAQNKNGGIMLLDETHIHEDVEGRISRKVERLFKEKVIPSLESLSAENAPKIEEQLHKAGERLKNIEIDIPEIESKINKVISQVTEMVSRAMEDNSEDIEKYKKTALDSVNKTWESVSEFVSRKKEEGSEESEEPLQQSGSSKIDRKTDVNERSRLKILELLEKGTINPEQAEKLIKALNSGGEE